MATSLSDAEYLRTLAAGSPHMIAEQLIAIAARLGEREAVPQLYAVLWEDRHVDASVHLFTDKDVAVFWASEVAKERNVNNHLPDIDELPDLNDTDYIACFQYSCEGDNLRVMAVEVDADMESKE